MLLIQKAEHPERYDIGNTIFNIVVGKKGVFYTPNLFLGFILSAYFERIFSGHQKIAFFG